MKTVYYTAIASDAAEQDYRNARGERALTEAQIVALNRAGVICYHVACHPEARAYMDKAYPKPKSWFRRLWAWIMYPLTPKDAP